MIGGATIQIHVVTPGESLWTIAQAYGTSIQVIVQANQIPEPGQLVVGQALVIPIFGNFYTVQPGDSLWSIGQKFNMNYLMLAQVNGIHPNQILPIGLRLYIPPTAKTNLESLGYIEPRGNTVTETLLNQAKEASPNLTYVALFS